MKQYDFGEKIEEYSAKQKINIPVWVSPKYTQSRQKAIEIIEKYKNINAGDFWILMNETKNGKMAYTGLIISHNACLKINDAQTKENKFVPSCITIDKAGYKDSLVYTYSNDAQGIYEVGEVSPHNCKNAYLYAMAYKRCFDRVVLKLCKLAYDGVYSDSEADEFKRVPDGEDKPKDKPKADSAPKPTRDEIESKIMSICTKKRIEPTSDLKTMSETELLNLLDALAAQ